MSKETITVGTNEFVVSVNRKLFEEMDDMKKFICRKRPFPIPILKSLTVALNNAYATHNTMDNDENVSETQIAIQGMTIRCHSVKEHLDNMDYSDAVYFLSDMVNTRGTINEWDIRGVHQLVLRNIDSDNAGRYRNCNVFISGATCTPPDFLVVPELMQQLVGKYESWQGLHPIVRAALLHGELVRIHPFVDGNGRTSRLLMNIDLMKDGFTPIVIDREDRNDYYEALDKAHATNDYTDFIELISISELKMLKRYIEMLSTPITPDTNSEDAKKVFTIHLP